MEKMTNYEIHGIAREIADKYGAEYLLRQTAEECAELAQACLKRIRAARRETPVTTEQAHAALIEEIADVIVMIRLVQETIIGDRGNEDAEEMFYRKIERMRERMLSGDEPE